MNYSLEIHSLADLERVAHLLKNQMDQSSIFTFSGSLGAGKTTLIQQLLKLCGIHQIVMSPTFTYVNIYRNDKGQTFYHFDLYRIKTIDDFINAGFNEYLYQPESWCFIEWPEVIHPLLLTHVCAVNIEYLGPTSRRIQISNSI